MDQWGTLDPWGDREDSNPWDLMWQGILGYGEEGWVFHSPLNHRLFDHWQVVREFFDGAIRLEVTLGDLTTMHEERVLLCASCLAATFPGVFSTPPGTDWYRLRDPGTM